jgi:hypothetical protein
MKIELWITTCKHISYPDIDYVPLGSLKRVFWVRPEKSLTTKFVNRSYEYVKNQNRISLCYPTTQNTHGRRKQTYGKARN